MLLISVDGLHQSDLQWYGAQTPLQSDSFPGMVGQVTGGNPRSTGVYYDAEYSHVVLPAGTTSCPAGAPLGAPVTYEESVGRNKLSIDAGQGLPGLPGSILQMTGQPRSLISSSALPVDPAKCKPIYPHQYLKVNTIFNVAHDHGLLTAWSDKHPAYEILNGPSGTGIGDLCTPEINSGAIGYPAGEDWTKDNNATRAEASDVRRARRRLPARHHHSRTAAGPRAELHQHPGRHDARHDPRAPAGALYGDRHLGQARPVAARTPTI